MTNVWPDFSYDLYERACKELNYPEIPYSKYINELVQPDDTVLDIGCGIGIPAIYISRLCKKVIAVDQNKVALDYFHCLINREGIRNIETIHASWPEVEAEVCDVAVSFYTARIADSKENFDRLIRSVKRGGIITCIGAAEDDGFYKGLAENLGINGRKQSCKNGCYLKGKLEMAGFHVKCEQVDHEFGQPVNDIDEAAKFFCWQLQLDDSYLRPIREIAANYMVQRNEKWYIPKLRRSCVLIFNK